MQKKNSIQHCTACKHKQNLAVHATHSTIHPQEEEQPEASLGGEGSVGSLTISRGNVVAG